MPPALSTVIVNWNTASLVMDCLRSLLQPPPALPLEVIVVDNGSTDDSVARITAAWPGVRLIRNPDNRGFAAANNQGIAASTTKYVLLLNSDTQVPHGAPERLVSFLDAHPDAASCAPQLRTVDGSIQPFSFGGDPTPLYLARRRLLAWFGRSPHDWKTNHAQEVDWVSGACLMARRAAIEQTGVLDEAMFMYFEDNDWCLRFRRRGWKVFYVPEVWITHLGGGSASRSANALRSYDQSLRHFYRKHYGPLARLWLETMLPLYRSAPAR